MIIFPLLEFSWFEENVLSIIGEKRGIVVAYLKYARFLWPTQKEN